MDKHDVARTLQEIALLLELKGENSFKIRAYENAARAVEGAADLAALVAAGTLTEIGGIGASTAARITELWKTGRMRYYDELVASTPAGYVEMMQVPGLGAKKIRALGEHLKITSLAMLKEACE
ncbi:MAG TPA: helix-hairpin-helix domain-containing protein [Candidatus Eisenbacteria bacterium]|nr:helix-hairpin-helix domain-containing protein [Candidatus Eisenbacteria bacterium]